MKCVQTFLLSRICNNSSEDGNVCLSAWVYLCKSVRIKLLLLSFSFFLTDTHIFFPGPLFLSFSRTDVWVLDVSACRLQTRFTGDFFGAVRLQTLWLWRCLCVSHNGIEINVKISVRGKTSIKNAAERNTRKCIWKMNCPLRKQLKNKVLQI